MLAKQTLSELANLSERDPWREVKFQASAVEVLEHLIPRVSCVNDGLPCLNPSFFQAARRVTVRDAGNAGIEGIVSQWDAVRWLQRQITSRHYFQDTLFKDIVPNAIKERQRSRIVVVSDEATAMDAFTKLAEEVVFD